MLDKVLRLDATVYDTISNLLRNGLYKSEYLELTLNPGQDIKISAGYVTFNPPLTVVIKISKLHIKTTITNLSVLNDSILVDVDNSPFNLRVKPNE